MSFDTGLSGLRAASSDLDVIGNNIANAGTIGFKKSRAEFADVYANSVLGAGATAIGMGVQLASVTQEFTQGNPNVTGNALDFAINGQGFFTLDFNGQNLYTRAGAFEVDNMGNIVNSFGANLLGFLPDYSANPDGTVSNLVGPLVINTTNLPPQATANAIFTVNLNSNSTVPIAPFVTGFTAANPPATNTYNYAQSQDIYDSLGNKHLMKLYFVKQGTVDQWQTFVSIDGNDVTPAANATSPRPFSAVFNTSGNFIANNTTNPPIVTQSANITSLPTSLINVGGLSALNAGDLKLNGVAIPATVADGISTVQANASAAAIQNAINSAGVPGISAAVIPASVALGVYSPPAPPATPFPAGSLVVNGVDLSTVNVGAGAGVFPTAADMAAAISTVPSLTATATGSDITVVAADGRNVQFQTNGTGPVGSQFANLPLDTPNNFVQRGQVKLTASGAESIVITGNAPLNAGFSTGTYFATVDYFNSDDMVITNWNPNNGAAIQTIQLNLNNCTQFGSPSSVSALSQDGSTTGNLVNINTDNTGVISATFSDGRSRILGQVILSNFANPQGLQPAGNTMWSQTFASGNALQGAPGGSGFGIIDSGQLEESNVDLTEELVSLIVAQRNFQANAQTIQTEDTTTQTIINLR